MSKLVLIAFCLLSVSFGTTLHMSAPVIPKNYDGLQEALASFMANYTGTNYNMTGCLPAAAQSQLDQILAASVGYLVTLKFDDVLSMYKEFLTLLALDCEHCGLTDVHSSLMAGLSVKGKIWFEVNLAFNIGKVETLFKTYSNQIGSKRFVDAAGTLGQITAIIIPYEPAAPAKLTMEVLSFNSDLYMMWWNGFIYSLMINPVSLGKCSQFLENFSFQTVPAISDISLILNKNFSGFETLFGDLASVLTYIQGNYTSDFCQFITLKNNIEELMQESGVTILLTRYAAKALSIDSAFASIKHCNENIYSCGEGYGTLIKYLLNWSIN